MDREQELQAEIDSLIEQRLDLTEKVRNINSQLSSKDKVHPSGHPRAGKRFTAHEYWQWRAAAVAAQNHAISECDTVKQNLRLAREELASLRSSGISRCLSNGDVRRLRNAVRRAVQNGLVLTVSEEEAMDRIEDVMRSRQAVS